MPTSGDKPPDIDDFPAQELVFRFRGDADASLKAIQNYLSERKLPSTPPMIRAPKVFVVTAYVVEPTMPTDRRVRRTAFRLTIAPEAQVAGQSACTTLSIASLTKSRGKFEELWSVQDPDKTYQSSAWPDLRGEISKRECK